MISEFYDQGLPGHYRSNFDIRLPFIGFHLFCSVGCSRYTGKVTDDKYRPVEVKANAKGPILAILGHSDSFVGVRK